MRRNHAIYGSSKVLMTLLARLPTLLALPTSAMLGARAGPAKTGDSQQLYTFLGISVVLVFLGGAFAGLTLGLMGQDEMYLKVISSSGTVAEQRDAKRVLKLIERGKHWVLVTLLLSNVITNETLPIVLDRCLGGGWQAVVMSTLLIVVFGEIIPQSVCVRYGLQVGAWCSPFVLALMYLMYPVAYPIAMLLDYILGEDHGTVYKKSGLKSLVMLHRTMGVERLTHDEVTIISAVLDLKDKQVQEIMTPIENVFTISANKILDEKAVEEIFNSGFSRIPIYLPGQPSNFIGMLLVRVLISYDPADALPVSHFPLATLPETSPRTSCLNILNYFQEGKSHMCVVSQNPGSSSGALGVLTLEDVIEELIGEEIVDESDVFVNIHQRIMREQPGPLSKRHITSYLHSLYTSSSRASAAAAAAANGVAVDGGEPSSLEAATYKNKSSDGVQGSNSVSLPADRLIYNAGQDSRVSAPDVIQPMNPAANPLNIKNPHVTVKRQSAILQDASVGAKQSPLHMATTYGSGEENSIGCNDNSTAEERCALISIPNHNDYGGTATADYTSPGNHNNPVSTVSTIVRPSRSLSPSKVNPRCLSSDASLQKDDSDNTTDDNENASFSASPDNAGQKQLLFFSDSSSKVVQSKHIFSSEDRVAYHESFKESYLNNGIVSTYRSTRNGIVESVITVEGVPKTIIEPALGWDDSNSTYLLSTNAPGYHYSGGHSEADNTDSNKKNGDMDHHRRHSFSK